jgi:hypothetical protein
MLPKYNKPEDDFVFTPDIQTVEVETTAYIVAGMLGKDARSINVGTEYPDAPIRSP